MAELSAKNADTIKIGDLTVNRLGLGTNRIADNDRSRNVLKRAVELGINLIDTAQLYGQSQEIIGGTLAPYPEGVIIATKGGHGTNDLDTLRAGIDESLRLLKLEALPLWQLHRIREDSTFEDTMRFLKEMQQAGKIQNIGLSEVTIEQIEKARQIVPIVSVQNHYNLQERQHEEVLDYCTKENIAFMPFFPLGSGSAAHDEKLKQIAQKYDATPVQIALAWLLKRSPIMLPIPGTLSIEHLESNLAAAGIELSDPDYKALSG
jgi:pyridoxine 4-dehydrogenase